MLAPKPAYFWDDTTNSWRKAVVGEAGDYVWNNTTNAWEFGTIGAEYLYNHSTNAWEFGPGGEYVYNHSTRSWDKVTSPGYGGQYYWDTTTNSWVRNANAASASDAFARWDFLTNQAWWDGDYVGALANTPNWTFTRASAGYAQNQAGLLIPFASGELRRTDKGVLIEGARTNLCLQSQTFGTTWSLTNATVSSDAAVAPDGTTTADKLVESASVGVQNRINQTITVANATAYAFSVYVKAAGRSYLHMRISTATDVGYKGFDLALGSVVSGGAGAGIITALANGWYRCTVIGTTDSTSAVCRVNILPASSSNPDTYTGDGTSGLYLWGAQLEATAFASSYVPTTTGSATRAADSLTVTGVTGLDYPLTLYAEFERAVDTGAAEALMSVDDGSSNNRALLTINTSDLVRYQTVSGGSADGDQTVAGAVSVGATTKAAFRTTANDVRGAKNGTLGTQDAASTAPAATPTRISLGNNAGSNQCYGYLRRAAIWSRALSDAELQAVTA